MNKTLLLFVTLLALGPINATAGIIYQAGDPDAGSVGTISDFADIPYYGGTQQVAASFTLSSGFTTISDIHWWGGYAGLHPDGDRLIMQDNELLSPTDDFMVRFFADDTGLPGTLISEYNLDVTRTLHGDSWFEYSLDISPISLLADTNYYLSVVNNTSADSSIIWAWMSNYGDGDVIKRGNDDSTWWSGWQASSGITFQLTDDALEVPEPSLLALLSIGLIGIGVVRKRS